MVKLNLNTNGYTPLADTASGAAGTLTGTERSKLQGILAGASRLATGALDGLMSAAHYAMLAAATSGNVANALVKRDGNGDLAARIITATLAGNASSASSCSGNAASASALSAGADRNKLDGIAAGATANPIAGYDVGFTTGGLSYNQWNGVGQFTLPAGTYLIVAQFAGKNAASANQGFDLRIRDVTNGVVRGAAEGSCGGAGTIVMLNAATFVTIPAAATISAEVYPNLQSGTPEMQASAFLTGERVSYMKAVRLA